jgi:glycosyltransferase involved in cell wall biosynthesis
MKNYKLAIVRPDGNVIPKGFYNSQELGLAQQLAALNIDVDVYYAGNVNKVTSTLVDSQGEGVVTLIELPFYIIPLIQQAIFPQLLTELKKRTYDLIQVNEYNDLICNQVVNYAHKKNIPTIVYQGMYKNMSGRFNELYTAFHNTFLLKGFIKKISTALTKTQVAATFLSSKGFDDVSVMPVGLDTNAFVQSESNLNNNELNDLYNIPPDHKVILYVGNFEQRRNITFLLDIAKHCAKLPITFLFIGEGELLADARQRVHDQNLNNVRLPGRLPQKQLATIYQSSDLFLLASDYEIYGMVVLEAMYYGVPVISNNTAGPASIIDSEINGMIIEEFDIKKWSSVTKNLLTDTNTLNIMKEKAKNKIEQEFTWQKIAKKYLEEILKKHCQ